MKIIFAALVTVFALGSIAEARSDSPVRRDDGPFIRRWATQPLSDAQLVYEALDVEPENRTPTRIGAVTLTKAVGGLVCTEIRTVGPMARFPKYDCKMKTSRRQGAIWNALAKVRSFRVNPRAIGAVVDEKKVGNLTCRSSKPVVPRAVARVACVLR